MLSTKAWNSINNCLYFVQQQILPHSCVLCGSTECHGRDLCSGCAADLARITQPCPSCGMPLEQSEHAICGRCLQDPPPFQRTVSPFYYEPPLIKLVTDFKFHHKLKMARIFADLLAHELANANRPEVIIPVPLHPQRLKERGYNQSLEIARLLGKKLDIAVDYRLCLRTRHTPSQSGLDAKQRQRNLKNAFALKHRCEYRQVAILDDVITTGNTVAELSRLLRKNGVEDIQVWSVARAVPD